MIDMTTATKAEIIAFLQGFELVTGKHDPDGLVTGPSGMDRSVLTPEAKTNLKAILGSPELLDVRQYENPRYPRTPHLFVVDAARAGYSIPGSGVPAGASAPTERCDCFVFASGANQGWHVWTDLLADIESRVVARELVFKRDVT